MRVLAVTNMYPTPAEPWFGSFVRDQIEDLRALGVEVEVLAFDGRRRRSAYAGAAVDVRRAVRANGFDLVHAHYGLTGAVALLQHRLPVVATFHGSDTGYVSWQGHVSRAVARLAQPIFVSEHNARQVGCAAGPIIPGPVDTDLFRPRDRFAARYALGWSPDPPRALFPGSLGNQRKRPDLFRAALEVARRTVPDLEAVSLEGLTREQAALTMSAVDVTVMTSDWEGSPVAVRESLACETPVVSVAVGDVEDVIAGLPGCSLQPREPAALAAGIVTALDAPRDPSLRRRAELTARRRTAERILGVYETVLAGRRA